MNDLKWRSAKGFCLRCNYELVGDEKTEWVWCFACGNGSPSFRAMEKALLEIVGICKVAGDTTHDPREVVPKHPRQPMPDINNYLQVPIEEDDECPNCHLGTLERTAPDVYVCRGECGAFFHGPCQHPNRNFNGGCDDCGDPSL
jgi:hypothetical protein